MPNGTTLHRYVLEEEVCGRDDLKAIRISSVAYSPDSKVTILACAIFNSSNATKSVSSYLFSKACKDVNYFGPVFSFKVERLSYIPDHDETAGQSFPTP
jgi:hypothetical protein